MKRQLLLSFLAMVLMILVMRWQGQTLVTANTPRGIIDLEFVRTIERLQQIQAVWQWSHLRLNIYLDFIFIGAYVLFFVTAAVIIKKKRDWTRFGKFFIVMAYMAGLLDVAENILMYKAYINKMGAAAIESIFYCAMAKFILIALLLIYLLVSLLFLRKPKQQMGIR